MAEDNKQKLYNALSKDYDMGSYEQFCTDITDDKKRRKLYDATINEYDFGDYDSFSKQLGFEKKSQVSTTSQSGVNTVSSAASTTTNAPVSSSPIASVAAGLAQSVANAAQSQSMASADISENDATGSAEEQTEQTVTQQPAWKPTAQQKIAMSAQLNDITAQGQAKIKEIGDKARRAAGQNVASDGVIPLNEMQASAMGMDTHKLWGLSGTTKQQSNNTEGKPNDKAQKESIEVRSPKFVGIKIKDGKPTEAWQLGDGTITTHRQEAEQAEYIAQKGRERASFENDVRQYGLDPNKDEDLQKYSAIKTAKDQIAEMERRQKQNEQRWKTHWRMTPEAKMLVTPEIFFILTPRSFGRRGQFYFGLLAF